VIAELITGDAATALNLRTEKLKGPWADLTVTSPPYNMGMKYADDVRDKYPWEEYREFTLTWLQAVLDATKPQGHLFLNVGSFSDNPMLPFRLLNMAEEVGWTLQNTFHWVKALSLKKVDGEWYSRGQFSPVNSPRYVNNLQEYVWHLTPKGNSPLDRKAVGVPYQDATNIERWGSKEPTRCRGNVWVLPYSTIQSSAVQRPHPAPYPLALAEICIKIGGSPKMVLDPFLGSGTSAVAADLCGVLEFVGIDLSPTYVDSSRERLKTWRKDETVLPASP
jgi:site-specific DNA-methyltransferase (adenine-specific)